MAKVPMGDEIPSNSQKSRQQTNATPQSEKQKPDIPVFEGETAGAKRKKKSGGWIRKMFFNDRPAKDIIKELIEYRIVPGIKDNFRNNTVALIDSFIYPGGTAGPSSTQNTINYNKLYSNNQPSRPQPQQSSAPKTEDKNQEFSNPTFKTHHDAEVFLAMMKEYDYPTLSVHTLYMMRKKRIDYTWDSYGWNKEEIMALDSHRDICPTHDTEWPYMINLPQAHIIME